MADILTDIEVEEIRRGLLDNHCDCSVCADSLALIAWGKYWQRSSAQNRRLADDYKRMVESGNQELAAIRARMKMTDEELTLRRLESLVTEYGVIALRKALDRDD